MSMDNFNKKKAMNVRNVLSKTVISGVIVLSATAFGTSSAWAQAPVSKVTAAAIEQPISYEVIDENETIVILFNEPIENNKRNDSELRKQIKLAANGTSFRSLSSRDDVSVEDNALIINLSKPITGSKNKVKIAKNSLKYLSGNVIDSELITDSIEALDITAPVYQGSTISSDNKEVTLIFSEDISGDTELKEAVHISTDGREFGSLQEADSAEIDGNKLVISFAEGLRGSKNVIRVEEDTLKDESGNLLDEPVVTKPIQARDIYAPEYLDSTVSNSNKTVTLFFDENIESTTRSSAALKSAIHLSSDGGEYTDLGDRDRVSIRNNALTVSFANAITGTNELKIDGGILSDKEENVIEESITAEIKAADIEAPEYTEAIVSDDNQTVTLVFDEDIAANKSAASLKAAVKISTDGKRFSSLNGADQVSISDNKLVIYLSEGLSVGENFIKVSSYTLKDVAGNIFKDEIVTEGLYVADTIAPALSNISIGGKGLETVYGDIEDGTITLAGINPNAKYTTGTLSLSERATVKLGRVEVTVPQGSNFIEILSELFGVSGSVVGSAFSLLDGKTITLTDTSGNTVTYTLDIQFSTN
ncbi:hypothetical protein RRU94_10125 [Domibacillus sp. DTU_2020_1001157_1_SI_ALB_TIR_016]|uniref:hypothetical protein n=1 Tax=Domibacillus sp. DTU_2020_1001157_1_SI_ALB_TIR_016 TaxID=3077789 RepID=UPI0028E4CD13|nr:hypothetical protein [Domibacillus sp. DTU_2020_1001157_1_SI_ALB_TIR_016]WNS81161.1 hypothetical protein RRU94_10125 [Domibacillus sp. DTU_2020_1001157_1_SI_ALB_TIR_016]